MGPSGSIVQTLGEALQEVKPKADERLRGNESFCFLKVFQIDSAGSTYHI